MRELTDLATFKAYLESGKPFAVWFGAGWCGPCRRLSKATLTEEAQKVGLDLFHCDVDHGAEIAEVVGVVAIPTIIYFAGPATKNRPSIQSPVTAEVVAFLKRVSGH
jgi:thioredoxin 1